MYYRLLLIIVIYFTTALTFAEANPTLPVITVTVEGSAPETIDPTLTSYTANICLGQNIKLEASSTGSGTLSYEWTNPITAEVYGTSAILEGALNPSQYIVTVTDDNGSTTSLTTIFICVTSIPPTGVVLNEPDRSTVCTLSGGLPLELTASASNQVVGSVSCEPSYKWYKDGVEISGENTSTLTLPNASSSVGNYTVGAVNACGEVPAATSVNISSVSSAPTNVSIESSSCSPFVCLSGSLTLLASAEGANLLEWYVGGGTEPIGSGSSLEVTSSGTYTVRAINGCGETPSIPYTVTITDNPSLDTGLPIFSFPSQVCEGSTIDLAPNALNNPTKYEWFRIEDGSDIFLEEENFPFPLGFYTASEAGEYKVRISNDCGQDEATIVIDILKSPTFVNIIPEDPPSFCASPTGSTMLSAQSNGEGLDYQWFRNSSPVGVNSVNFTATETGVYTVEITSTLCGTSLTSPPVTISSENINPSTPTLSSIETSTCDGSILLTSTDLGNGVMYEWRRSGTLIATTATFEYEASSSGDYQVIGKNACGDSPLSNTLSLTIDKTPSSIELKTDKQNFSCDATSITIFPQAQEGTNLSFELFKDGLSTGEISTTGFSISQSGQYSVEASNSCGSEMSAAIDLAFTTAPSQANTQLISTACSDPIVLSVQSAAENLDYEWYRNNALVGTSPTFEALSNGTYRVRVRNTCVPECIWISLEEIDITIGATLNVPTVQSTPIGENNICPGESIDLEAQISNPSMLNLGYRWFKENDLIDDTNTSTITVSETGNYYVEAYSLDDDNCSQISIPYSVFVRQQPELLLTFSRPLELCEGDSVRLQVSSQVPLPDTQYTWFRDDVLLATGINSIFAKETGTYRVEANYLGGEVAFPCEATVEKSLAVQSLTTPIPDITNLDGLLVTSYQSNIYQWNFNGVPILDTDRSTFFPIDSGFYSITVFNELGCPGTSEDIFHFGVYPERDELMRISPNPNNGAFNITIIGESQAKISIFDSQGRRIADYDQTTRVNSLTYRNEVRIEGLSKGSYIVRVEIDGNLFSKKVIIN